MKKIKNIILIALMLLCCGCISTYLGDKTYDKDTGNLTHSIVFYRGSLLAVTSFEDAIVDYNGVRINLTRYSDKGDVDMMNSISEMVVYSLASYASFGSYPTTIAIIDAFKSGRGQMVVAKVNSGETVTREDFELQPLLKQKGD